jgi:hypothetical protein
MIPALVMAFFLSAVASSGRAVAQTSASYRIEEHVFNFGGPASGAGFFYLRSPR